ncbi:hypothetical protein B296_00024275 [Ensete ventricosum]|uniref:Ninja-family protein n=1 Tax=Ensete ventricosum TaxID=4639 RepID=A0A427AF44_ENSVE|nr:hypothetical protein B296_00024275 [Ensete ventricosum]
MGIGLTVSDVPFDNFFRNNVGNQNQGGKQAVFPSQENFKTDIGKCSAPTTDGYDIAQSRQSQFSRHKELHITSKRPNEFEEEKLGLKKPRLQSEKINFQKNHEKVVDRAEVLGKGPDEVTSVKHSHLLVAADDGSTGENEAVAESEAEVLSCWLDSQHVNTAKRSDLLKGTARHALSNPAGICVQGQILQTYSGNTSNVELPKVTYGTPLSLQPLTVSMVPYPIPAKPTVAGAPITTSSPSPYVAQPTIPTIDEHPVVQGTNTDDQQIVFGYSSVQLPALETNSSWAFGSQHQIVSALAIIHMPELLCHVRAASTQMHPSTNLGYENKLAGLAKGNGKHVVETGASSSSKAEDGKGISSILGQKETTNLLVVEGFRHDGSAIKPGVASNLQFGGCGSFPDLPWVSATGPGPKGKTISGVTYKSIYLMHVHRSAAGYFLLALMIAGTLLGLRILLYVVAKCLQRCRGSFTSDDGDSHDEIEMQARNALALQQYYRQQLRRPPPPPPPPATSSSFPRDEWQSKLGIAAGPAAAAAAGHELVVSAR